MRAELVVDAHAALGEGPIWDARTGELLWVDIMPGLVHRYHPASGADRIFGVGRPIGAIVPRAAGGYAFAVQEGFAVGDADGVTVVAAVNEGLDGVRMNDGACDGAGRFWAGSMHMEDRPGGGALYRLDADGSATTVLPAVTISNGIGWSPDDRTMYYIDTHAWSVDALDFDPATGEATNRRTVVAIDPKDGGPDGLAVDAEGCIWVALWEGWAVRRYAPDGTLLATVEVPVARVTKPAFGGHDLDDLYITTASPPEPDPAQPHAGGLFRIRPGVRGLPANAYAG